MKIGGSLRAIWITISALGLRCESQGGPGLVVIHYNGYELPSKSSWAGLCSPWASVGNRLFCAPLAKFGPLFNRRLESYEFLGQFLTYY